jgi:hypothetical protein
LLSVFTQTLPDDLAAAMSASEIEAIGAAFAVVFLAGAEAGAALDAGAAAGALAAGAGFADGVGAAAGAAIELVGAEAGAAAGAAVVADVLFFDDSLLAEASAAGAEEVESVFLVFLDDFVPVEASAAAVPEDVSEEAADLLLLVEVLLVEPLLSDDVLLVEEDAAELSVAEASAFLDFFDLLVVVVADWSLLEPVWDWAQPMVMQSARKRHDDTHHVDRAMCLFTGFLLRAVMRS